MSAYIVDDITINRIVSTLQYATERGWTSKMPDPKYNNAMLLVSTKEECKNLGNAIRKMNEKAIIARYNQKTIKEFTGGSEYQYTSIVPPQRIQAMSSIKCLLYQCAEGNVPEDMLYQVLDKYAGDLATMIVQDLPEYDKAIWG